MSPLRLTLPWPPTVNTYWRRVGDRTIISAKGRAYREEVAWIVRAARANRELDGPLAMEAVFHPPDRRRRDIDNLCKGLLDALQVGGAYRDDSQIRDLHLMMREPTPGGKVEILIQAMEPDEGTRK